MNSNNVTQTQLTKSNALPARPVSSLLFVPQLLVKNLQFEDGKMIPASKYFSSGESASVELTDDEKTMAEEIRASEPLCHLIVFISQ